MFVLVQEVKQLALGIERENKARILFYHLKLIGIDICLYILVRKPHLVL